MPHDRHRPSDTASPDRRSIGTLGRSDGLAGFRRHGWRRYAGYAVPVSAVLIALMACLDYVTGPELAFSIFYLIPVALSSRGHEVHSATDGPQAWTALERNRFDLLISETRLPGMSGTEWVRRAREAWRIPAVLVSGCSRWACREEAQACGAAKFLSKSIPLDRLSRDLEEVRARRRRNWALAMTLGR